MKKNSYFRVLRILIVLLIPVANNLYAQDEAGAFQKVFEEQYTGYILEAEGLTISEVNIEKPKRTRVSYLKTLVSVREGDVYTKDLHAKVYLNLWFSGIFKVISVTPKVLPDNTVSLDIFVADKWTLIPIPILSFSQGYLFGVNLFESNFLGLGKYLSVMAIYGSNTYNFGLTYIDPKLFRSPFQLTIENNFSVSQYVEFAAGKSNLNFVPPGEDSTKDDADPIRLSEGLFYNGNVGLGYLFPFGLVPKIKVGYYYFNNEIKKSEYFETSENKYESSMGVPITASLSFNTKRPYGLMSKGLYSSIDYTYAVFTLPQTHTYSLVQGSVDYGLGLDSKRINLLKVAVNGAYGITPTVMSPVLGGTNTSKSILGSLRSDKYISGALSHSIKLWEKDWGGMTFQYGGDLSYYKITDYDEIDDPLLNGGVFGGVSLILKAISFPDINIYVAYNISNDYYGMGIYLGGL